MKWIKCSDRQPKFKKDRICCERLYIVACYNFIGNNEKLYVTAMHYERRVIKGEIVERWMWNGKIAKNNIGEPVYWMDFPKPPRNEDEKSEHTRILSI